MEEDLLKIINYYGIMPQLKYFQSEVFELNEAIIRHNEIEESGLYRSSDESEARQHITEEIADVFVMLMQFVCFYKIDTDDIGTITDQKIKRQLERIKESNENN